MVKRSIILEICANSVQSSVEAQKGGAERVELCAAIPEGGTTPSYGEIKVAREQLHIALNVIIRPRSGDFLYSNLELEAMKQDIIMCREQGVDGVVFGALTPSGEIDIDACRELMSLTGGMSTTFHRAFDVCKDPSAALEQIIDLGFDRILTSGCANSAYEGRELIAQLVEKAADRIIIMPGCGVTEHNIAELEETTKAYEFHLSARTEVSSKMVYQRDGVSMGGTVEVKEFSNNITSALRVRNTLSNVLS